MNILRILSILSGGSVNIRNDQPKEILSEFPGCGQLGSTAKIECMWKCDWRNSTIDDLSLEEISKMLAKKVTSIGVH